MTPEDPMAKQLIRFQTYVPVELEDGTKVPIYGYFEAAEGSKDANLPLTRRVPASDAPAHVTEALDAQEATATGQATGAATVPAPDAAPPLEESAPDAEPVVSEPGAEPVVTEEAPVDASGPASDATPPAAGEAPAGPVGAHTTTAQTDPGAPASRKVIDSPQA